MSLKEVVEALEHQAFDVTEKMAATESGQRLQITGSPQRDHTVNIKKGEIRKQQMASFQNWVQCSHKPSLFIKVAQVLGITQTIAFSLKASE